MQDFPMFKTMARAKENILRPQLASPAPRALGPIPLLFPERPPLALAGRALVLFTHLSPPGAQNILRVMN